MRISDWSSDVCSSDLDRHHDVPGFQGRRLVAFDALHNSLFLDALAFELQRHPEFLRAPADELADGVLLACRDDVVLRIVLLQHHPLHPAVILCVPPVAQRIQVAHEQAAVQALRNVGQSPRDLACHAGLPSTRALVVEEDSVRSEEHTSELQSLMRISYAVFCLKKKKKTK